MDFERMRRARLAQLAEDGEATAVPEVAETRLRTAPTLVVENAEPGDVGEPVPGALGVLAFVAFSVSVVLAACKAAGADIGVVWVLAPMWGSALVVALAGGIALAVAWARRHD